MTIYGNLDFIDKQYTPKKDEVLLLYRVTPAKGVSLARAAEYIAGESSIGTWTKIQTMNPTIARTLKPHVFRIDTRRSLVEIAYPAHLFELGNLPGLLSSIAGNIYGMKGLDELRLEDIGLPKAFVKSFPGPLLGIPGIRRLTGKKKRPLLGTIVKPKVGLTSAQHAQVAFDAWRGGLDVVKDDENLTSLSFNTFEERMKLTFRARDEAERETGEMKVYLANITAETEEMKRRARVVKRLGGEYVMIDILTVGWAALQTMRTYCGKLGLAIHAHRAMHAALTRNRRHGISMLAIAKLARLVGVDQLHIGTANVGKMDSPKDEVLLIEREIEESSIDPDELHGALHQEWYGLKPTLAVASGGLSPLSIPPVVAAMGTDIVMQFGGGCHGHPDGTYAGAKAIRQAWEAVEQGISLSRYAATHPELARAMEKWGGTAPAKKRAVKKSKTTKRKMTKSKTTKNKTTKNKIRKSGKRR